MSLTTPGISGQPKLTLTAGDGASAELYLHGAHVTSWKPAGAGEQLFLSAKSDFGAGAAIRGGVPVIFPQFSLLGPLPRHGFVRNQPWELAEHSGSSAKLTYRDNAETLAIWPYPFQAELTISVSGKQLDMQLRIVNTGTSAFSFSSALHTYLCVDDIDSATVAGLQGLTFRDANTMVEHLEEPAAIKFGEEVDRLYYDAIARPITLHGGVHQLLITQTGFPDAVVWNPGKTKSDKLADMEPDGWRRYVCVEAAAAHNPVPLAAGAEWVGRQTLVLQK